LYIGPKKLLLQAGNFIVAIDDVASFPWRRKVKCNEGARRATEDHDKYPEVWRVAKSAKKQQHKFKTLCRIVTIHVKNVAKGFMHHFPVPAGDVSLEVVVFVRPADVGQIHRCPFEVIETDQGNLHSYGFCGVYKFSGSGRLKKKSITTCTLSTYSLRNQR
jgi:hypothetical protein